MSEEQINLFDDLPESKEPDHFDPDDGFEPLKIKPIIRKPTVRRSLEPVNKRAETMKRIVNNLPLNEFGLPLYIYRSDMIPPDLYDPDYGDDGDRIRVLDAATVSLDYLDGAPSLPNGMPLWSQLPFEGVREFQLFLRYLGAVKLDEDTGNINAPLRMLENVSAESGQSAEYLRELSFTHYWQYRVKAHDLFMVASYQKQRETRAIFVENSQFKKTGKWLNKFEEMFETMMEDEDIIYDIEPKKLFDMFMEMMRHQRISVGLPANGRNTEEAGPKNASLEVLMRDVAIKAGEKTRNVEEDSKMVDELLEDPEALAQLQNMIIQTSKKGK